MNKFKLIFLVSILAQLQNLMAGIDISISELRSTNYTTDKLVTVLAKTQVGQEVLGQFNNNLPIISSSLELQDRLSDRQLYSLDKNVSLNFESNGFTDLKGLFVPMQLFESERDLAIYKAESTMVNSIQTLAHELQHSLDHKKEWKKLLVNEKDTVCKTVKKALDYDNPNFDLCWGLIYVIKYVVEYRAYKRGFEIKKEILKQFPELSHELEKTIDPESDFGQEQLISLLQIYSPRLILAIEYLSTKVEIVENMKKNDINIDLLF